MICPNCQKEAQVGDGFCAYCGTKLADAGESQPETKDPETAPQVGQSEEHPQPNPNDMADNLPEVTEPQTASTAQAPEPQPAKSPNGILGGKRINPKVAAVIAACVAIIVVAIGVGGSGLATMGQTGDTFRTALEQDSIVTSGIASNQYLNESAYGITAYSCSNIQKVSDFQVSADIEATIENENYITDFTAKAQYYDLSKSAELRNSLIGDLQDYEFKVVSSQTTPKKGIDFDLQNGIESCESTLSEDALSCTVDVSQSYSTWFVDSTISGTYDYTFDGKGWKLSNSTPKNSFTYKDLDGDYQARTGALTKLTKFTVGELDPDKGTFTITYECDLNTLFYSAVDGEKTISGSIQCAIDPTDSSSVITDAAQEDGLTYHFEGKGNSTGGNGQASVSGYITTSDSGEKEIHIERLSADYTMTLAGNSTYSGRGSLYRA